MASSTYVKTLFVVLSCIYMLPYVQSVCMGVTSVDMATALHLDSRETGLLGSSYLYAYAFVQFFSGMVAVWLGPRRTLGILLLVSAAGCLLFSQAETLAGASAARAVTAVGMAVVLTSALTLFGRWYPPQAYARLCAWLFAIGGMGSFLGTMPMSFINDTLGWRAAQTALALCTLAAGVLVLVLVRDWPRQEMGDASASGTAAGTSKDAEAEAKRRTGVAPLLAALRQAAGQADFWRLCAWYALMSGTYYAFGGLWGGPYLTEVHGLSVPMAGSVLSMGAVGFVAGNPLMTLLCQRVLHSWRLGLAYACLLGLVGAALLVFVNDGLSLPMLFAVSLMLGFAANAPNAVGYAAARSLFGVRLAGSIGGILGFSSFLGGACLQTLCGQLLHVAESFGASTAQGYAVAFAIFVPCSLGAAWASFRLTENWGQERE